MHASGNDDDPEFSKRTRPVLVMLNNRKPLSWLVFHLLQQAAVGDSAAPFAQGAPDSDVLKGRRLRCMP
jgi:hypothetical protein